MIDALILGLMEIGEWIAAERADANFNGWEAGWKTITDGWDHSYRMLNEATEATLARGPR